MNIKTILLSLSVCFFAACNDSNDSTTEKAPEKGKLNNVSEKPVETLEDLLPDKDSFK